MATQRPKLVLKPTQFATGSVLFKQNEKKNKDVYILHKGKIGVYVDEMEVAIIEQPGAFIGESAALLDVSRNATCVALADSLCTVLPGNLIDKIIVQYPAIGLNLLKMFAKRVKATTDKYIEVQKDLIEARREMNRVKGVSARIADYDVLSELLCEMGYVTEEQVEHARRKQEQLAKAKVEKTVPALLVDMGIITMYEMIEGMKLQRELSAQ